MGGTLMKQENLKRIKMIALKQIKKRKHPGSIQTNYGLNPTKMRKIKKTRRRTKTISGTVIQSKVVFTITATMIIRKKNSSHIR
jgi:hypothetical protein